MVNVLDYFDEEKIKIKECIVNTPGKKYVFREEVKGEVFYIKKYIPYGKKIITMNLYLKKDRAKHYEYISKKLTKIQIPHMEPLKVVVKKKGFFKRESLIVTKYGGEVFEEKLREYSVDEQKKLLDRYFNYYVTMAKNKIYVTDYNTAGALINETEEIRLIDFDAYKKKYFLTGRFKKHIINQLYKANNLRALGGFSEETCRYVEMKIEEIIEELGIC